MTNSIPISFDIDNSDSGAALGIKVRLDNTEVFNSAHVTEAVKVNFNCSDDDGDHQLEIELYGKLPEHTKIDDAGAIVKDAVITVKNITIDGIDISEIFTKVAKYTHNFNGTGNTVSEIFYDTLGCNGVVRLEFTTPVYLWLLENM